MCIRDSVCVAAAQTTVHPRFSATNLNGSMVLLLMITGTTLASVASIGVDTPLTVARLFPIHRTTVLVPSVTVTLWAIRSHVTILPRASMIARIGSSVLEFLMTGAESSFVEMLLSQNMVLPI